MKFSQSRFTIKYTELHEDAHQFQLRFSFEPPNTIYLYYYQYKRGPHINMLLLSCFSHVRLCATPDGSPPGSSVPGILQARTLEWVAISFSNAWKRKVKVMSLSRVTLSDPMDYSLPGPPSMGFSRQEYWSGVPLPSPYKHASSNINYIYWADPF